MQLALVAGAALVTAVIGGIAGYGTGILMPLVLVPILGPEPVVPVMSIASFIVNAGRIAAFRRLIEFRPALIVLAAAVPTCVLGAWLYTRLSGAGAQIVIGAFLMASVPLCWLLRNKGLSIGEGGLAAGAAGFGVVTGAASGTGVILVSLLMAAGLGGAAVIATDAAISLIVHLVQASVFGVAGVIDADVIAVALLIGIFALPGAFVARAIVDRLSINLHTAILDVVVLLGGGLMVGSAILRLVR
ncbi:MAG TPA: sulfite exporter TauE/SafE family protein [Xanthobacteraceae bacterium]